MSDSEWKALANSVSKLRLGQEKDGIGKFLYEIFERSETRAQLASHLASIFVNSGAWIYNEKKEEYGV